MTDRPTPPSSPSRQAGHYRGRLLPPDALTHAPAQVTAAHAALVSALDQLDGLVASARAAHDAARAAETTDRDAARAAVGAGKSVPASTVEAAKAKAQAAERASRVGAELVAERFDGLLRAVADHADEWRAAELAACEQTSEDARAAHQALAEAFAPLERSANVLQWLHSFNPDAGRPTRMVALAPDVRPSALLDQLVAACNVLPGKVLTGPSALERRSEQEAQLAEHRRTSPTGRARAAARERKAQADAARAA